MPKERHLTRSRLDIQFRDNDPKGHRLSGLAAVFYREGDDGTEYLLWDGIVERIRPGAFDRALRENQDVVGLYNHDPSQVLGRTGAGTMRLERRQDGLGYVIDLAGTERAEDLVAHIKRGDVAGSSFGFSVRKVTWEKDEERKVEIRWLEDVDLYDVGPVTFPAYEGTSTAVDRSAWQAAVMEERAQSLLPTGPSIFQLAGAAKRARVAEILETELKG